MRAAPIALLAALALALAGCGEAATTVKLAPLWTVGGLADPESVAAAPDGQSYFVTNVAGEADARDGVGFISRVSRDGRLLELRWAEGLDAPKGATIAGDRLIVSDVTRLVEIDVRTGKILARHEAPGAGFLNDTAVTPAGLVLAADSAHARIYALEAGRMVPWAEAAELKSVNGLLPEPGRLVATTMEGRLLAVDYDTRRISVLAEGLGQADGVAALGGGRYLVSEWPGRLFAVGPDGRAEVLIDSRGEGRYINDFILQGDRLVVPHWKPGALQALRLDR